MSFEDYFLLYGVWFVLRRWKDTMFPSMPTDIVEDAMSGDLNAKANIIKNQGHGIILSLIDFIWLIAGLKTPYTPLFAILMVISLLKAFAAAKLMKSGKIAILTPYAAISDFVTGIIYAIFLLNYYEVVSWIALN